MGAAPESVSPTAGPLAVLLAALSLGLAAPRTSVAQQPIAAEAPRLPKASPASPSLPAPPTLPAPPGNPVAGARQARLEVQCQLQVEEAHLVATVEVKLTGSGGLALDLDREPLQLPFPAPVVAGVALDHGTLPATSQSVDTDAQAPLSVSKAKGGWVVRGKLKPGEVGTVRARTVIAFKTAHLRLGISNYGAATWASVVVMMAPPTRVRLAMHRPARITQYEQGQDRLVGGMLAQHLRPGEVAIFDLDDLPAAPEAPRRVLSGLAVAMAGLWGLWLGRRRTLAPAEPPT